MFKNKSVNHIVVGRNSLYVPRVPILVLKRSELEVQIQHCLAQGMKVHLWSKGKPVLNQGKITWIKRPSESDLFSELVLEQLCLFEHTSSNIILIEKPPKSPHWEDVNQLLESIRSNFTLDIRLTKLTQASC